VYSGAAMTMTRINVFLPALQRQKLAERSEQTGAPVAELIRRAIDEYLSSARRSSPTGRKRSGIYPRRNDPRHA
jgi:hypothetical protein